ncbi:MAG: GNAT family N-acetyltransferase [Phycisphaerae bacterium]|nr:GNAT family N-acetyltransferase [Phycisphaerae bacterium]
MKKAMRTRGKQKGTAAPAAVVNVSAGEIHPGPSNGGHRRNAELAGWEKRYPEKIRTAAQAVACVQPGQRVYIGSNAGEPQTLVEALSAREDLLDTEIVHILTLGVAAYAQPRLGQRFRTNAYFIGANVREAVQAGRADYTPIFLSEIPALFRTGRVPIDVAMISVSPPDSHGYCSYGVSCDIGRAAAETARLVIAEVNMQMPRVLGDCFIHMRDIDLAVPSDRPVLEAPQAKLDEISQRIGRHIANLIEDGSTLQLGIGAIPDAVLHYLGDFKDLGIHTEMFSDGIIPLIEKGVITNAAKNIQRGKIVMSFCMGTQKLYDFIHNNPSVECHPTEYTNDPFVIAQNDKMVSINSAIEVDLTGQVCADSLGVLFYSGIGGQVDFVRGAARSKGGKPIIALPSTTADGIISRIVPTLKPGAGVVTSRGDVHYIVTEHGVAYLHGKSIRERALALIQIAEPKFRPWLLAEAKQRKLIGPETIELTLESLVQTEQLEFWVRLKDQTRIFMRPMKLTDLALLRSMFYELAVDISRYPYLWTLVEMPAEERAEALTIDYDTDMCLVALTGAGGNEKVLGIAHYRKDIHTNFAHALFVVRADWQNRGIGRALLEKLVEVARARGIAGFTADVVESDQSVLRLFHNCGYAVEGDARDGYIRLTVPFGKQGPRPKASAP